MKWMVYKVRNGWLVTNETTSWLDGDEIADSHIFTGTVALGVFLEKQAVTKTPQPEANKPKGRIK